MKKSMIILCCIWCIALSSCQPSNEDGKGEFPVSYGETVIEKRPERVLCFSPALTDMMVALGNHFQLAGVGSDCKLPAGMDDVPHAGTLYELDAEAVGAIDPDLILTTAELPEGYAFNRTVLKIENPSTLAELQAAYEALGACLGGNIAGRQNGWATYTRITGAVEALQPGNKSAVFMVTADQPATGDTLIGGLLKAAGIENKAEKGSKYNYDLLKLKDNQPDVIICFEGLEEKIMSDPVLKELDAVKNNKVFAVDRKLERRGEDLIKGMQELSGLLK